MPRCKSAPLMSMSTIGRANGSISSTSACVSGGAGGVELVVADEAAVDEANLRAGRPGEHGVGQQVAARRLARAHRLGERVERPRQRRHEHGGGGRCLDCVGALGLVALDDGRARVGGGTRRRVRR
jgi:hypothetical protein